MQPPENEQELVQQARRGDKSAVSTLYEAYAQAIFQYINYRVESEEVAEDLTGDVFMKMVQALPEYQYTGAPFGAWLFRIASNRITDHYRENRRNTVTPIAEDLKSDAADISHHLETEEERTRLRLALAQLSEEYQNVLVLRFMRELSHAEVAMATGKTEVSVRVMQHRALKALATALAKIDHRDSAGGAQ